MKNIVGAMRFYRKESVIGPLFKLLEAIFELIVPLVVASLIDNGITGGNRGVVWSRFGVLVLFAATGLVCSVTAQFFAAKAAVGVSSELRQSLFSKIQRLSYAQLDTIGTPTLITRITEDVNQVQNGLNLTLRLVLRSPFIVFGAMIMAFTVDVRSAMIFVAVIPALAAVVFLVMFSAVRLYGHVQTQLDTVLMRVRETLSGVRVIRAFNREESEIKDFRAQTDRLFSLQIAAGRISAVMNPVTFVLVNFAAVWLIQSGAVKVNTGDLTTGQVVALYNYMAQILVELVKLASLILTLTRCVASAKRVEAVLNLPDDMPSGALALGADSQLEFRGISFRYPGAAENALEDISFHVPQGSTVGIIGSTGSGKSTLVNLIPRFYDVTGGAILLGGRDIREYDQEALRKSIGVVPQKSVLFSGSIRDNLKWGDPDADDARLLRALEAAQAAEIVTNKPGGLDEWVEQGGRNFSGGQRQRLAIARALVRRPRILILDDSASALDYATDAALRKSLRELDFSPTVFLVSQRASSVRNADRILVLENGRAVGFGTSDELLQSCSVYREIYRTQFKRNKEETK